MTVNRENFAIKRENLDRLYKVAYEDAQKGLFEALEIAKLVFEYKYLCDEACEIIKSQDRVVATQDRQLSVNKAAIEKQTAEITKLKADVAKLKEAKKTNTKKKAVVLP